jgi:hypothetical protein
MVSAQKLTSVVRLAARNSPGATAPCEHRRRIGTTAIVSQ